MGTLQVGGTTLATKNSSTGKVDLNSTNTAFPSGHMIFIKSQHRDGVGDVGDPGSSFFPTTTTDLATKSFYLTLTSTEHAPFSKIKIDYNASCRMDASSQNMSDYRLVRWIGTGNVSSETVIVRFGVGTVGATPGQNYFPLVGSAIDDISSVGSSDQINYTLQYRNMAGNSTYSGTFYFGHDVNVDMQMNAIGII